MNLFEMMQQAQGGQAMTNLASQFGLSQQQTQNALEALLPAFSMGLQKQAQDPNGLAGLAGMMTGGAYGKMFDANNDGIPDYLQSAGQDALGQLFGSKEVSRAVAAQAAAASGVSQSILKQMLPVIASMVIGGLFKSANNQGLGGLLGQLANGMFGGTPAGQGQNPMAGGAMAGNPMGDLMGSVLSGMLGGAQQAPRMDPGAPPQDPMAAGLEALTRMFDHGRQVQDTHQNALQSIFDAMLSGQADGQRR